ncbi:MAG: GerMN domain-containing protein [Treponema sp.]|nr:GerMN domain-containing protein [Treponema sp.]
MKNTLNAIFKSAASFLASPVKRRLLFIAILGVIALVEFFVLGLARRTFVFYNVDDGVIVVEDRMLKHSKSKEEDIIRYTEETLLGPVSPELLPLFPRDTKLKTLMYRNRVVYADFTESAALSSVEGGSVFDSFRTLYEGISRNFSYVKDIRFYIEGNAVFLHPEEQGL